jgi:hypothetical protein
MESKSFEDRSGMEAGALCAPAEGRSSDERFLQCHADLRAELSAVRHEMHRLAETLRVEIRAGDAETRRYMRVMHEEVLSRIAAILRR